MNRALCFVCLLLASGVVWADARVVTVKGRGTAEYQADMIRVGFSVFNKDEKTVEEAKNKVERSSKKIVQALIGLGVSEEDIHSPAFTVDLDHQYDMDRCPSGYVPVVGRDMEVLLRDVKLYRKAIDTLVENGATSVRSVTSELSNREALEKDAMLAALKDAKEQAQFLVESLGANLGKVHSIGEKNTKSHPFMEDASVSGMRASKSDDAPYEFKPAPVEISAEIYVEFAID